MSKGIITPEQNVAPAIVADWWSLVVKGGLDRKAGALEAL
jgi:hypothetical protein